MRAATAYFAGVGTVAVAIAAGLGGGLLLGDIMSPQQPKHPSSEVTRLEQHNAQRPIAASNDASQPVPYLASSQVAATMTEPAPQAKAETPPQQPPQQTAAQLADAKQADAKQAPDTKPSPASAPPVASAEPAAGKDRAAPEDSFAKARDSDLKAREADIRREARDRRKAERRQQWAERRRIKSRERGDDDLRDVEASVRDATEQRPLFGSRSFDSEPRFGSRINLFDD